MAALLKNRIGIEPDVIEGRRGEFSIWVGETLVAQKDANGFPEDDEILVAVQAALTGKAGP